MIHSIGIQNFYSIKDYVEIDFTVNDKVPNRFSYTNTSTDDRVSIIEAVVGANASGKTNILKALPFMRWLVVDAYTDEPDAEVPVKTFGNNDDPSIINVSFSIEKRLFTYSFELNQNRILSEKLIEKSKATERTTSKSIFSREWNSTTHKYVFTDKVFNMTHEKMRKNSSVVATAFRDGNKLATEIAEYWRDYVLSNVFERGYRNEQKTRALHDHYATQAIKFYFEHEDLKEMVESILRKYDLGFDGFNRTMIQDNAFYSIKHNFGLDIPIEYESSGTKQMIIILQYLLLALTKGGIAVIDELDSNLHPEIVEEIISMFTSPDSNPKSAQLLLSSHTPTILSSLDKYQIILVEKASDGTTDTWRLDSLKGIRPEDNFYLKYIAGAYGGVPKIG